MANENTCSVAGKLPAPDPERFKRKSKDDIWARRGLGKSATAVDGWVEMFSAFMVKLGCDVDSLELERWMDTYYQLRYEAEREADMAKFVAGGCKVDGELEPVVPKANKNKGRSVRAALPEIVTSAREESRWGDLTTFLALLGLFSIPFGPKFCGPEVKDSDEKGKTASRCHGKEYCDCKGPDGQSDR